MAKKRGPCFVYSNWIGRPYTSISLMPGYTSAAVASLPASNLATEEPSEVARIAALDPFATRFKVAIGKGVTREMGAISLIDSNLSPWGKYRFTVGEPTYQYLAPTSIVTASNLGSGTAADVDEDTFAPDNNWIIPFLGGSPWSVELGFPTPTTAPLHGASRCWVSLIVRHQGSAITDTYPAVRVVVKQAGDTVVNLGTRPIISSTGQLCVFSWDAADMKVSSGANLSVEVAFENASSTWGELGTCRVAVERVGPTYDSGWLPSPAAAYGDDEKEDGAAPSIDLPYYPPTPWTISAPANLFVQIMDDQIEHDPDTGTGGVIPFFAVPIFNVNLDFRYGYVQAGVLFAGKAQFLSKGFEIDDTPGGMVNITQTQGISLIGNSYATDLFRQRAIPIQLIVTRDELITLQDRVAFRRGMSSPFYFAAEPDIEITRQRFNSGYMTMLSLGQPGRLPGQAYDDGDGSLLFSVVMEMAAKL